MKKPLRLAILIVTALSLAGCGILFPSARMRAEKDTPSFKNGYSDGCASAAAQSANRRQDFVRDEEAYQSDRVYRAGWASGFYNCRTGGTRSPGQGPIPDNGPGSHSP
jgi:predicted small lipoprotein YifL